MKKLALALALILGLFNPAVSQQSVFTPATTASVTFGAQVSITKIISGIAGKSIYITAMSAHPAATSVVTFSYGTGTNCGTGTTVWYGPSTFQAGENIQFGSGYGALFVIPSGKDVCVTITTANAPGWLSYSQF